MRMLAILAILLAAGAAAAEPAHDSGIEAVAERLTDDTLRRIRRAPARLITDVSEIVLGFGSVEGIDAAGLDRAVDVQRAKVRAREIRRFALADLDDDGNVTAAEVEIVIAAEAAGSRAKLVLALQAADTDGDGAVGTAEARAFASATALKEFTAADAATIRNLMALDLDANGRLTVTEVVEAVRALQARA